MMYALNVLALHCVLFIGIEFTFSNAILFIIFSYFIARDKIPFLHFVNLMSPLFPRLTLQVAVECVKHILKREYCFLWRTS
jgi:hypothetical protein